MTSPNTATSRTATSRTATSRTATSRTATSRTATPARTGRPDTRVRAALWVLIVLSAAANAAISITGLGLLPHLLSGLVCLGFVVALVVVHRRR